MKILFKFILLTMITPLSLFGRELTLMHDKGGTPNYQPYFEEISTTYNLMNSCQINPTRGAIRSRQPPL